ncbi:class I SAM-dependent methyltransferase [Roseovarius sp. CAU 1744]|uniref:class I SAM-dependent methyltransferase n=1 Tax=Roseovarius sp. CAU 1744 TaxID=3140368 RepID=UPI00325AACE3
MSDRYYGLIRDEIFPFVPMDNKKLLDIGGGFGGTSSELKRMGRAEYVVLTDLVADNHDPDVDRAFAGNLDDPAFVQQIIDEEGPFDCVLCLDVLEHLREPWDVIAALHKGLSPNGVIVASIPNMRHVNLVGPLVLKGKFELRDSGIRDRTHLRWFTRESAIQLMESSGLTVEKVTGRQSKARWHKWTNLFTFGIFRAFFEKQYMIVARNT